MPTATDRRPGAVISLLTADVVSLTGNRIERLVIPWFVLSTTGSPARAGLVAFASFFPPILSAFGGGVVVDRLGPRRISIASDLLSAASIGLIPALHVAGKLSLPVLVALVFMAALLDAPGNTARRALLPRAASIAGWRLETATSAQEAANRTTQIIAGGATAFLVLQFGAVTAIAVDAGTFLLSAFLVWVGCKGIGEASQSRLGMLDSMREGLKFLSADQLLLEIALFFMLVNFLEVSLIAVFLPVYSEAVLGDPLALGLPIAALGAGTIVGAIGYATISSRVDARRLLVAAILASGPTKYMSLALELDLAQVVGAFFLAGIASGPVNPIVSAAELRRIPEVLRGRVLGTMSAAVMMAIPVGVATAGLLSEYGSLPLVFGGAALLYAAVAMMPALRQPWSLLTQPGLIINDSNLPPEYGNDPDKWVGTKARQWVKSRGENHEP